MGQRIKMGKIKYRMGELFCGAGGLALGAKLARVNANGRSFLIKDVWATDYDKDACETYRRNIMKKNPGAVICEDIRKLEFKDLLKISEIDALAFGFPCNDFSVVGEQKGINGSYGPLYTYCAKAIRFFRPKWFLAENVSGLRNSNEGKAFQIILQEFCEAGYRIYPHLYKFEQYGVPQARHRVIIIGIRRDLEIDYSIPSPEPYAGEDISCRNAIENPPIKPNTPNHDFTKQSPAVAERLKYIKPGENAFTADLPEHLRLKVRGAKLSMIYKRLNPDMPAYTVTGSGGGGTHVYHWAENRALTNRERARLQTFPDDFVFSGSKESVRRQIGMAVPVKAARIIFESVLKPFAGVDYSKTDCNIPFDSQESFLRLSN